MSALHARKSKNDRLKELFVSAWCECKRSPPLYGVVHGLEGLGSSLQEVLYTVECLHCAAYRRRRRQENVPIIKQGVCLCMCADIHLVCMSAAARTLMFLPSTTSIATRPTVVGITMLPTACTAIAPPTPWPIRTMGGGVSP